MAAIAYHSKQVRTFLLLLLALAVFITFKSAPRTGPARPAWLAGEAVLIGFFLLLPKLFFPVFRLIMKGSSRLGGLIFFAVMIAVFVLFITPFSAVMRLFGKKFMLVRRRPEETSYFEPPAPESDFRRQF